MTLMIFFVLNNNFETIFKIIDFRFFNLEKKSDIMKSYKLKEEKTMAFETKISANKYRIRGVVDNVSNQSTHYGRFYRLFRSIFFNEPFQFAKGGKNKFAETSCYCIVRVSDFDDSGISRQIICYNDLVNSQLNVDDEVEFIATKKAMSGTYVGCKILNVSSGACINAKSLTVNPHVIRGFFIAIIAAIAFLIYSIVDFFANGGGYALLYFSIPIVLIILGFSIMFSSLFPKRRRRYRDYNNRWRW